MRKTISTLLVFFTAVSVFAFEGGGLIQTGIGFTLKKNTQTSKTVNRVLNHSDSVTLWARQNMDKNGDFNFNIQGSYFFSLKKDLNSKKNTAALNHILDIELLKFSFFLPLEKKNSLQAEFGRYGFADITNIILNQQIDGLSFIYRQAEFSCLLNLGYTGLLNAHTVPIHFLNPNKNTPIYRLCPSFFQISSAFHIPAGKTGHSIDAEFNSFIETKKNGASKTYFILSANGQAALNLFFILSGAGSLITAHKQLKTGLFINGELNYYFSKYGAKVGGKTQWFSGGEKTSFEPFTKASAAKTLFIDYSDLLKTGLTFSIKPITGLFINTDFGIFCKGLKQSGKSFFTGFEWTAALGYTLLDDIFFGCDAGIFVDNDKNINSKIDLKGTVSF